MKQKNAGISATKKLIFEDKQFCLYWSTIILLVENVKVIEG
jgi:hypothetical protein